MKAPLSLLAAMVCLSLHAQTADTLYYRETQLPVLTTQPDNVLYELRLTAEEGDQLDEVSIAFADDCDAASLRALKLYYRGLEVPIKVAPDRFAPDDFTYTHWCYQHRGQPANRNYSRLVAERKGSFRKGDVVRLSGSQRLSRGTNYVWVSMELKKNASLDGILRFRLVDAVVNGRHLALSQATSPAIVHRKGVGVKYHGEKGAHSYRIPGIVQTDKGTLVTVYDCRYDEGKDLQHYINVGCSRSTDGGRTWHDTKLPALAFGENGDLPRAENGVGDPAILFDPQTKTLWAMALWDHGLGGSGNNVSYNATLKGTQAVGSFSHLVAAYSKDDGRTWSAPIDLAVQIKDPSWVLLMQGPGCGTVMSDGTLVFAGHWHGDKGSGPCVIYSKDHGATWKVSKTTMTGLDETQVAEIEPGVLMVNSRANGFSARSIFTTRDMGETWHEHPTSKKSLVDPQCQASLLQVNAADNALGRDLLLFSNPSDDKVRKCQTIKVSLDKGMTWLPENQLMLDEKIGNGYSCLVMLDSETVGIFYESSMADLVFQRVKLNDLVKKY